MSNQGNGEKGKNTVLESKGVTRQGSLGPEAFFCLLMGSRAAGPSTGGQPDADLGTLVLPFWWGRKDGGKGHLGTQKVGGPTAFKNITKGPSKTRDLK